MNRVQCELIQEKCLKVFHQVTEHERHQTPEIVNLANEILEGFARMGRRPKRKYSTISYEPVAHVERHPAIGNVCEVTG